MHLNLFQVEWNLERKLHCSLKSEEDKNKNNKITRILIIDSEIHPPSVSVQQENLTLEKNVEFFFSHSTPSKISQIRRI